MANTGILIVNFASADKGVRAVSTDKLLEDVKNSFSQCTVREVCSGKAVRRIIEENEGIKLDSIEEALLRLKNDGIKNVICQPSYLMEGTEYDALKEAAFMFKDDFESIKIGKTLTSYDCCKKLVNAMINAKMVKKDDPAIVMAGHGSAHSANKVYFEIQKIFEDLGYSNVIVGTLESKPDIDDVLLKLDKMGVKEVTLMPLLSVAGHHSVKDIFGDEKSYYKSLSQAGYNVNCVKKGLCEYKEIRDVWVESIAGSLQ